jgi:inward rectifier potassium channel
MHKFDPGFGQKYAHNTKRIINKDGSFNITRTGIRNQQFQTLVEMSSARFSTIVLVVYLLINFSFAVVYLALGVDNITFIGKADTLHPVLKALYFSMQTFTTVGFGSIYPSDSLTNFVSGMEAMMGWMFFAIATGMVYRRFSRPSARILFSNNALISPYKDGTALMFRIVNRRPNVLMEVEARVMLALDMDEGEETMRRYFNLKLETTSIHFFPLSWTIVHPIDDTSPMQNLSAEDMFRKKAEVLILMKAFDETFSQHVHVKFSYTADEIVWNARFIRNFKANTTGEIELDIDAVHDYEKLD